MRSVSKKRNKWLSEYRKKADSDFTIQECQRCNRKEVKYLLDRHHPNGRRTLEDLLFYIYLCRRCHDWVHSNAKEARSLGFLK